MASGATSERLGAGAPGAGTILDVVDLKTHFYTEDGIVKAVDGVSFRIDKGKVLGVVGESGCGKSITALSIMRLVPRPGRDAGGRILYHPDGGDPVELTSLAPDSPEMTGMRGNRIAMIFQEPMSALNPVLTIGAQIMEAILLHRQVDKLEARELAVEMLTKVGISDPGQRVDEYPFQLSGGMRQRAVIAMALSCRPNLLIADEPTTALDVTVQAQILRLMRSLQDEMGMSIMVITHDLGVIAKMAHDVVVMYLGKIVERGSVRDIFHRPVHPYTKGLLNSIPRLDEKKRLVAIKGVVPTPYDLPPGCGFARRCPAAFDRCSAQPPEIPVAAGHAVRCWLADPRGEHAPEQGA
jgi:oligopeptide/dipeptide ABC transporter ATP-binding protein